MQRVSGCIEPKNDVALTPVALKFFEARFRHEECRCKVICELLNANFTVLRCLLEIIRRHNVPRKDVKQLVSKIEVAAPCNFVTVDQHGV